VVAGFCSGLAAPLSFIATLPAVEQQALSLLPFVEQQDDLPSAMVEHSPSLPQQPLPSFVEHFIPAAEQLQPSLVPPTSSVASALAGTDPSVFGVVEPEVLALLVALVLLVVGFAEFVEFDVVLEFSLLPQPASPRRTTASNAASLIFMA